MGELWPGLAAVRDVHPLVVHFPIALWGVALALWAVGLSRRDAEIWQAGRWLLYFGSLAAVVAVGTGLWAADRLGHDSPGHDVVHVHRNLMVAATILGVATALGAYWLKAGAGVAVKLWLIAGLVATTGVCAVGADRGALLVYGHGVGTQMERGSTAARTEGSSGESDGAGVHDDGHPRDDHERGGPRDDVPEHKYGASPHDDGHAHSHEHSH